MEKQIYKSEKKVDIFQLGQIPNEVLEKRFIMDFLHGLDLEHLKELVGFKKIDFRDKETWKAHTSNHLLIEQIYMLRDENVVKYTTEIQFQTKKQL